MDIHPQERQPVVPPFRNPEKGRDFVGGELPPLSGKALEDMREYFGDNHKLTEQYFYAIPMVNLQNYDAKERPWAKKIIREAEGRIMGLPHLGENESWITFVGPDGNLYATKSTPATSGEIEKWIDEAK
ncbi:MAG: hypothetical protein KGJ89_04205 [Patescibacteria group bacterium]|nr:hypothetical protein [Patescibacteria group bacterium]MDE2015326.1 hypothetical protein [Patescibacteria group bacterium]MDE2227131.1 hypothetical protein [Patescibacteria group bacterium]